MNPFFNCINKIGFWILSKLIKQDGVYGLLGDIEEIYHFRRSRESILKAEFWLWKQILASLKSYFIDLQYWGISMLKNYFKVAFRSLVKQKVNSFINIFGLSIGIAVSILVILFVVSEKSYDKFHDNYENIFRVTTVINHPERGESKRITTPNPFKEILTETLPQVDIATRIVKTDQELIKLNEKQFKEDVYFVDPEFFDIFSFPVHSGNSASPMSDFSSIVISQKVADKFFGNSDPIGKIISINLDDKFYDFKISCVIDQKDGVSSIEPTMMISYMWLKKVLPQEWAWDFSANIPETIVRLKTNYDDKSLPVNLQNISKQLSTEERYENGIILSLQPFAEIHNYTELSSDPFYSVDAKYITLLIALGVLVLIIASINFMTLAIGRSAKRAKEVGVRKVIGAFQGQLVNQYLSEAILTSFLGLAIGGTIAYIILPLFNEIAEKSLKFSFEPLVILFIVLLVVCLGLFAGGYPSFILARFNPVKTLYGKVKLDGKNWFSKSLVVLQFSVSVFLIIATLVISSQLDYFQEKELGYDDDKIIEVSLNSPLDLEISIARYKEFEARLLQNSNIKSVSGAFNEFGIFWTKITSVDEEKNYYPFHFNMVDVNFLETMGIELIVGRNFSNEYGTDFSEAVIVNEALVKEFNLEDPLKSEVPGKFDQPHRIIGVVKDFNFSSLHDKVEPLALALSIEPFGGNIRLNSERWPPRLNFAFVKIGPGDVSDIIEQINLTWDEFSKGEPFEFNFLDERIEAQYQDELRIGKIIDYSSVMAIIIASLGLFGLATIAVENRVKEIGIRKVLGAKLSTILFIVSKDLLILVIIANLIAWPVAYYILTNWLENFAYRIDLSLLYFFASGIIAFAIAIFTISYNAIKAANMNPVTAIKYE